MKGITHCTNKDSPESIIIWHKKRSGFFTRLKYQCEKCLLRDIQELEHQCHEPAPAASHRTILEKKSSRTETCLGLVTTARARQPWTPHWIHVNISAIHSTTGGKGFSASSSGKEEIQFSLCLQSRSQFRNGTCQKMHQAGIKPDLQNSLPNTGKPFRMQ